MKHVGYGVTVADKPSGIWPLSWSQAKDSRDRKRASHTGVAPEQIQVVEVHMSGPIADPPVITKAAIE